MHGLSTDTFASASISMPTLSSALMQFDSVPEAPGELYLKKLQESFLIHPEDWEPISEPVKRELQEITNTGVLLAKLVDLGLLTEHQAARISAGTTFGLILGNYRVLNRLGAGGMGVVFEAEHIHMRRRVAVKVGAALGVRVTLGAGVFDAVGGIGVDVSVGGCVGGTVEVEVGSFAALVALA